VPELRVVGWPFLPSRKHPCPPDRKNEHPAQNRQDAEESEHSSLPWKQRIDDPMLPPNGCAHPCSQIEVQWKGQLRTGGDVENSGRADELPSVPRLEPSRLLLVCHIEPCSSSYLAVVPEPEKKRLTTRSVGDSLC
jgi:hypothetical protein